MVQWASMIYPKSVSCRDKTAGPLVTSPETFPMPQMGDHRLLE